MNSGTQPISITIDGLLDQSIDPGAEMPPGVLRDCVNLRKDKLGRLVKREGQVGLDVTSYTSSNEVGLGTVRIASRGTTGLHISNGEIATISEASSALSTPVDRAPQWTLEGTNHINTIETASSWYPGSVTVSGTVVHIWVQRVGSFRDVYMKLTDEATGATIRGPVALTSNDDMMLARVVSDGTNIWVFAQNDNSGAPTIKAFCTTIATLRTGALPSLSSWKTDIETLTPSFDVALITTNRVLVAYTYLSGGTHGFAVFILDSALATISSSVQSVGACRCIAAQSTSTSRNWVAYILGASGTTTRLKTFDTTLTVLATTTGPVSSLATQTQSLGKVTADSVLHIAADITTSYTPGGEFKYAVQSYSAGAITTGTINTLLGGVLASAPFSNGVDVFAWVDVSLGNATNTAYNCVCLLQLTFGGVSLSGTVSATTWNPIVQLRVAAGRCFPWMYTTSSILTPLLSYVAPQKVYPGTTDVYTYRFDVATSLRFGLGSNLTALGLTEYQAKWVQSGSTTAHMPLEAAGLTVTSGGIQPFAYDGQTFSELGFCYPPGSESIVAAATGGSIAAGTYSYALTFEYIDGAGNRHQSAPRFTTVTQASGSTNRTDCTIYGLRLTAKQDVAFTLPAASIVVWRTLASGDIYYRVGAVANSTSTTVSFTDTYADASISANEVLYTSSGELANEMPPPLRHCVAFGNRLAGIDAELPERIVFSKPMKIGRGPEFSSILETWVRGIGNLTALASMDGTLYAFSKRGVAVAAYGDGQDATGAGTWPIAQIITRAAGCVDCRALCVTQEGIVFCSRPTSSSPLRVWLLPRGGGNPVEIGAKVQLYLDGTASLFAAGVSDVAACVNWEDAGRVMISITSGSSVTTRSSCTLEYDYRHKTPDGIGTWTAFVGEGDLAYTDDGNGTIRGAGGVSTAAVVNGRYLQGYAVTAATTSPFGQTIYRGGRYVARSTPGTYYDNVTPSRSNEWIAWRVETHDIRVGSRAPIGKLNSVTYQFETAGNNATVNVAVKQGGTSDATGSFAFTTVSAGDVVSRHWQPANRRSTSGKGYRFLAYSASNGATDNNSADVLPRTLTLDYIPQPGTWLPQSTERT